MPTREQVWKAADRIFTLGVEPVSVATVIAELRKPTIPDEPPVPCTQRTVDHHVKDWKVAHDYSPRPRIEILPERLRNVHAKFLKSVWAAATEEADARREDERQAFAAEKRANDALRVEAMVEAEAARAEAARLRTEADVLRVENAGLRDQVARVRERFDHIRSEVFWDRVMQEAYEYLPPVGTRSVAEIIAALPTATLKAGRLVKERLSEGTMRKKMEERVRREKFFARREEDAYSRLPGWDGALGRKIPKD